MPYFTNMMKNVTRTFVARAMLCLIIVSIGSMLLQACGSAKEVPTSTSVRPESPSPTTPTGSTVPSDKGNLQVRAMDAPPDGVTKILITVSSIEVQRAGGDSWQVVVPGPVEFDLVDLQGIEETLGEALLEPGQYGQVRLFIDKAEVTVKGETVSARVPSDKLRIVGGFSLEASETTILTLDFDAGKSVVIAGTRNVLIEPVITMLTRRADRPLAESVEVGSVDEATEAESGQTPEPMSTSVALTSRVTVAEHPELGTILVDGGGLTLYLFTRDTSDASNCTAGCAITWPPLLAAQGDVKVAGEGADSDLLGSITREDGSTQVTYNGHALYNFSGDRNPGDSRGYGVGHVWFGISPSGEPIGSSS